MYRFVILAVVLVFLNPLVLSAEVEGEPDIRTVPEENTFAPGETGRFTFSLLNDGEIDTPGPKNLEQQVLTAEGLTYSVGSRGNGTVNVRDGRFAVGSVPDGLYPQKLGFRVSVWDNASSGIYGVPVDLSYDFRDSIEYNASSGAIRDYEYDDEFVEKEIIFRVRETADFELVDSSYSGSVGDSGILSMEVKNRGNASVSDVSFNLDSRNPDLSFGRTSSAEKYIGDWEKGETKDLEFKASVAENSLSSDMTVEASANFDNDGFKEVDSFSFGVLAGSENKVSLEGVDGDLRRGSEGSISGSVVNDAGRDLNGVELVFRPDDPYLTVKQSSFAVGDLGEGEIKDFSFPVEVSSDAEAGPRLYSLSAVYRNADGDRRLTTSVDFNSEIVDSEGDFLVEPVNNSVVKGSSGTLRLNVTNPSSSSYEDVDAKIFTSDPISSSDDRAYISELEAGESEVLSFKASSSGSALAKSYPVRMDFRYELDGDSKFSDTYRSALQVREASSSGNSSASIVVLVVVLVALGAGSFYFRKPEKLWEMVGR